MLKEEIMEKIAWTFTVGNDKRRISIYTMNGTQIGLAGVGEGEEALTFPAHWDVQDLFGDPHWIKLDSQLQKRSNRLLQALLHHGGTFSKRSSYPEGSSTATVQLPCEVCLWECTALSCKAKQAVNLKIMR